jgi:hypothetical protein
VGADSVDVHPNVAEMMFKSIPTGAQITIDGQPVNTPYSVTGVSGILRDLHAIEPQALGGSLYVFVSWSQGGEALQTITTPDVDTEYVATFAAILGAEDNKRDGVYPIPTQNEFFVPWNSSEDVPAIRLMDMYGHVNEVPVSRASDELLMINVRNLPQGMYMLSCVGSAKKLAAKVAIVR